MDEGTYADAEVARLIQEKFIAVKVDRDELPEVDRRYQRQVGALTGEGGWPLTAFLTAEGSSFLGGTYFPPADGLGRPGFRRVLREIARIYSEEPEKVRENTAALRGALARMTLHTSRHEGSGSATDFLTGVRERIDAAYDPVNAGFGAAPKFPHPTAVSFLLWVGFATGEAQPSARARETLLHMADGGMYDQIGGGFHRYSVDEGWHIPHFEKMGIDNAALLSAFVEGFQRFGDPRIGETIRGTLRWIRELLAQPGGGFGTSQDADNAPGDDGQYFTWSRKEMKRLLSEEELRVSSRYFGIGTEGRMPHDPDQNVLYRLMPVAEVARSLGAPEETVERDLRTGIEKLRVARGHRATPAIDPARYANINGPLLGALAKAGKALGDPGPIQLARLAADAFLDRAWDPARGIAHRLDDDGAVGYGRLEDNAAFAAGLVELAGATADPRYAKAAEALLATIDRAFTDPSGLLRDLAPSIYDGPALPGLADAILPVEDAPHISPNATTVLALVRYGSLTGRSEPLERAKILSEALVRRNSGGGLFASGSALAAGLTRTPAARVVVEGEGAAADALARAAEGTWHPNLWVFRGVPPDPFSLPEELAGSLGATDRGARALVCFGQRCLAPVTAPSELRNAIEQADRPSA